MYSTTTLASDETAPARARLHAHNTATAWGRTDVRDDVELVVSEMVTNAVQATGPAETIGLHIIRRGEDGSIIVAVTDGSSVAPRTMPADRGDLLSEHGRGMGIIDALSADHGHAPTPSGKVVWALLPAPGTTGAQHGAPPVLHRVLKGLMALPA